MYILSRWALGNCLASLLVVLFSCTLFGGCGEQPSAETPPATAESSEPAGDIYEVRGRISKLPDPTADGQLYITHERIDGFRDRDGKVVGMDRMTMPFPVASSVDLTDYQQGDAVRFHFAMDWPNNTYTLFAIEKLPEGVELDL